MKQTSLFDSALSGALREAQVLSLNHRVARCKRCPLAFERKRPVLGEPREARLVLVGEAPSAFDETHALLFGGKIGGVLDWMLEELEVEREHVFFVNAVACRPSHNRPPDYAEEITKCRPYFEEQLQLAKPRIILAMGDSAAKALLKTPQKAMTLRDEWLHWKRIPVRVTYHPGYVLRAPGARRIVRDDLHVVRDRLKREESSDAASST